MIRKSGSAGKGLVVCFILLFVVMTLSVQSQSNVAQVTVTGIEAQTTEGQHPKVTLYVSVMDDQNQHVSSLSARDFAIKEFTKQISTFEVNLERQGVAVDLVVDVSGSMEGRGISDSKLEDVREAMSQFISSMSGEDLVGIFTFAKVVEQIQSLEPARAGEVPETAIPTDPALQATCLYDAARSAIEDLASGEGGPASEFARRKKAIFVFSDGKDSGLGLCSYEAIDVKYLIEAEGLEGKISVYAIGVGPEQGGNFDDLRNLADVTKGEFIHYYDEGAQERLNDAFGRFLTQGEQYVVSYATETCEEQVTVNIEVGGKADEATIAIEPVNPIVDLSGVEDGESVSGVLTFEPIFLLEQCPIREVNYYVNGEKMSTMVSPFIWELDTTTLPDDPGLAPSEEGLIEEILVQVEAVDQKGRTGTDEISGIVVEIPHPEIEITEPDSGISIDRAGVWRTECQDAEPLELPVKIEVTHSNRERRIERVRYRLDDQEEVFQQLPAQYVLDISSLGCSALDTKTNHTLYVEVTDDLGLSSETEIPLTVSVHIETTGEAAGRFFKSQGSNIPAWLSLVLVLILGAYVLVVGPQKAVESVAVGIRKVTEFLGVVSKGTRLVSIEDGKDGQPYAIFDVTNMGRDESRVDIAFDNVQVSRLHATLVKEEDEFVLYDQGSKNGTWVNERRLPFKGQVILQTGDIIELGRGGVKLRFEREGEAEDDEDLDLEE
jgi:hypothetical protein